MILVLQQYPPSTRTMERTNTHLLLLAHSVFFSLLLQRENAPLFLFYFLLHLIFSTRAIISSLMYFLVQGHRGVGSIVGASQDGAVQVGIRQLDSLDVFLLVLQRLAVFEQDFQGHSRGFESDFFALSHVDQLLADVLEAHFLDELSDLVVVHTSSQGAKEIDGLAVESFNQASNVILADTVSHEDTVGNTNTIFKGRGPVELFHTTITNQRSVQSGEIVTGGDNRDSRDLDNFVLARQLNVRGVIRDVHQRGVHHLVVDGVLRGTSHSTGPGIKIVNEQGGQLTLLDDVGRLAITLTNQLGRLTGVTGFQFTSRHNNRRNAQLLKDQVRLESLTLTLTTPDTQNQRNLDLRQVHKVLRDVHGGLVQKGRGDVVVVTIGGKVVQVLLARGDVVRGGHDGVVRAAHAVATLELGVNHVSSSGDVLLVIGDVFIHAFPSGHLHLGAVGDGGHLGADEILTREGAGVDLFDRFRKKEMRVR
jgi:hypothetical protein